MEPVREIVRKVEIVCGGDRYVLTVQREDFSAVYPGMIRYTVTVTRGNRTEAVFRTNAYEYSPLVPLRAEEVAMEIADAWETGLRADPGAFLQEHRPGQHPHPVPVITDLVVIQGSPRADGNCSILAGWAADAARDLGRTAQVIYPHDLDIHCCIGCYQCYNTGFCVFTDDMTGIIDAIRGASVIVICSPVYTVTVPAGLKLVLDRSQAYHAERVLTGGRSGQKGLAFVVAGRKGEANLTCVTRVLSAFFANLGIAKEGEILLDSVDATRDIRMIAGIGEKVREAVKRCLSDK
jgi:multimeric flavodoxin WrbA